MSSNTDREIEARGKDVETAIESGLAALGLSRKDVIVEVVDEGSRGLLGIGSREAIVRLTSMMPPSSPPPPKPKPRTPPAKPKPVERAKKAPATPSGAAASTEARGTAQTTDQAETAVNFVSTLLQKMDITATVAAALSEPDDLTGKQIDIIEVNGDDLGILIGPRGDTLSAIQYIARLSVGHQMRQRTDFVIDIQGYRQRRELALSKLAERMAKKALQRGQAISLEPMPPQERRIIHMALRENEQVYTESVGEGRRRKVQIIPK